MVYARGCPLPSSYPFPSRRAQAIMRTAGRASLSPTSVCVCVPWLSSVLGIPNAAGACGRSRGRLSGVAYPSSSVFLCNFQCHLPLCVKGGQLQLLGGPALFLLWGGATLSGRVPFCLQTSLLTHAGKSLGVLDAVALKRRLLGVPVWALVREGPVVALAGRCSLFTPPPPLAYYCETCNPRPL